MNRQELIRARVNEILGSGVVTDGPKYFTGAGVVTEGPKLFTGAGVVTEGPKFFTGAGHRRACPACHGTGFFEDLWDGIKSVGREVLPIVKEVAPIAIKALAGAGKRKRKASKRNQMIKEVMKKTGMTLPEASRYLKENGY